MHMHIFLVMLQQRSGLSALKSTALLVILLAGFFHAPNLGVIGKAMAESCGTRLFFPNRQAVFPLTTKVFDMHIL